MFGLGEVPHRGTGATQKLQNIHRTKTFEKATKHSAVFNKTNVPTETGKKLQHWESEHNNDEKMWSELWAESIVSHLFSFPGVIWLQQALQSYDSDLDFCTYHSAQRVTPRNFVEGFEPENYSKGWSDVRIWMIFG